MRADISNRTDVIDRVNSVMLHARRGISIVDPVAELVNLVDQPLFRYPAEVANDALNAAARDRSRRFRTQIANRTRLNIIATERLRNVIWLRASKRHRQ